MTEPIEISRCGSCGAEHALESSCRLCFESLLAFENERPSVFDAVHHLTVAAYFLQHPAGYSPAALSVWLSTIADTLDGLATISEVRGRLARRFAGAERVTIPHADPPEGWPTIWPMTVQKVFDPADGSPEPALYIERARAWAAATRTVLDASAAGRRLRP